MKLARVLVVDDNPVNLKLASDVLDCAQFEVSTASDADSALSALRQAAPDLIMMDIALPGMDGLTLTRQIKADPATRNIVIVALTAYAMKGDDQRALDAGCDDYITKPIDTRRLPGQIADILQRCNKNNNERHA